MASVHPAGMERRARPHRGPMHRRWPLVPSDRRPAYASERVVLRPPDRRHEPGRASSRISQRQGRRADRGGRPDCATMTGLAVRARPCPRREANMRILAAEALVGRPPTPASATTAASLRRGGRRRASSPPRDTPLQSLAVSNTLISRTSASMCSNAAHPTE